MKKKVLGAAIAALLAPSHAYPGEMDVFVFLDNNPLQGVDVRMNGELIGQTSASGELSTTIASGGKQTIVIEEDGEALVVHDFQLSAEQETEISIVLSKEDKPKINIYKSGQGNGDAFGFLRGQVQSPAGQPLADAQVSVAGIDYSYTTSADGSYSLDLPRGTYELSVYHPDYAAANYQNIRIIANVGTAAVVKLKEKNTTKPSVSVAVPDIGLANPTEEVLILGHYNAAKESSFTLEQMSTSVVDVLDIGEIERLGDSDLGSIVKRVVGVAVVDGKYAIVRGMDGRYISATLNKNLMPTTNAFKRDAELDLFPTDILGGLEIQKSFSADLPADSTAGTILIKTRKLPDDFTNKISASLGMTTGVAGDDFISYEGSDSDFWGVDDGLRELPGPVYQATNGGLDFSICQIAGQTDCVPRDEAAALTNSLPNIWNIENETAPYEYSLGYTIGHVADLSFGTWSIYASGAFDKDVSSKQDGFVDNPLQEEGDFDEDKLSTNISAYLVTGFTFNDDSYIDSKTVFIRNTDDTTRFYSGFDNNEDSPFTKTDLEWKEREFFGQYFSGFYYLAETHELDWRVGVSQTNTNIPDRRTYRYQAEFLAVSTIERLYGELTEDGTDFGLDYKIPFQFNTDWRMDLKAGLLFNNRERDSELVRLGYRQGSNPVIMNTDMESLFTEENINNDAFRLNATSTDTDQYVATQEQTAYYFSTETHYSESLSFIWGIRSELFEQELNFPNDNSIDKISIETEDIYPSLGVIYRPNETWQFKFNVSETISRPTLTELAPTRFYDEKGDQYIGNPDLAHSDIQNFDARADYYFAEQGSVSLAYFNKVVDNPVEVAVVQGSGSAADALTWRNENEATLQGVELDVNKEFLNTSDYTAFVAANVTWIDSEVTLEALSQQLQGISTRELQGQSPFLGNIQIGLDHFETAQKFTFLVNYFDDRIYKVTRLPYELIYEAGRMTLDFNYEIALFDEKASLSAKLKNITNEEVEYLQGDNTIEGWKNGTELSVGFSYNF